MGDRLDIARAISDADRNPSPSSHETPEGLDALDLSEPRVRALPIGTLALLLGAASWRITETL